MLWLYTKDHNIINFYQVFVDGKIEFENNKNTIYSLGSNIPNISDIYNIPIDQFKSTNYKFTIRIIDQLISFDDQTNLQTVFSFKMNFKDPSTNKYNLPIFNYTYKKVNNNRMPNLIESNYNFYKTLEFKIYKINDQVQFIIETDPETKIIKKYFTSTNLNLLDDYLKK